MCGVKTKGNSLYKKIFARSLAHGDLYQDHIYGYLKGPLFEDLEGHILEIGAGTGINLPYLPEGVSWTGLEPNTHMHRFIYQKATALGMRVDVLAGYAESLALPDKSLDGIICTLVLCSVPDQEAVMQELKRVLKPGGRFVFIEHVGAPKGTGLRVLQRTIKPFWRLVADGCRPDRDTQLVIEQAGFSEVRIESFIAAMPLHVIKPHIMGVAVK